VGGRLPDGCGPDAAADTPYVRRRHTARGLRPLQCAQEDRPSARAAAVISRCNGFFPPMIRLPTSYPAAPAKTPPPGFILLAVKLSPSGPRLPAWRWLHNHAPRQPPLNPSRHPICHERQADGAIGIARPPPWSRSNAIPAAVNLTIPFNVHEELSIQFQQGVKTGSQLLDAPRS
jgi:hypothetical protein